MNVHDPVSAAIQGATSPPDALCFAGATDCGVVGLTLARDAEASDPASGAEQVLRLAQAEPLIAAVEQWLQSAWDPAPVAAAGVGAVYQAVVRDPALLWKVACLISLGFNALLVVWLLFLPKG